MIKPRNKNELKLMRKSGHITGLALKKVLKNIKAGVSGLELDRIAEQEIKRLGGDSSFKSVKGYKWTICITINEQVVHGIPTDRVLEKGDLVSIDLGAVYKGWHTDAAWSVFVGEKATRFLLVGEQALWLGIEQAVDGQRIGDIGEAIQTKVEGAGYSVVRSLVGHGVGKSLHEDPYIPGYGKAGTGLILKSGQTLAIEVIYNMGKYPVVLGNDGWTIISADGSLAGLFEMSVIVGPKKAELLTYNLESGRMDRL